MKKEEYIDFSGIEVNGKENCYELKNNGDNGIICSIDTMGMEDGYYAFFMTVEESINMSNFGQYEIEIENLSDDILRLNPVINTKNTGIMTGNEGKYIVLESEDDTVSYVEIENECVDIPADFKGKLKVPFCVLKEENDNTVEDISYGFGVNVVVCAKEKVQFSLKGARLVESEYTGKEKVQLVIEGKDSMLNPTVGESIEFYESYLKNICGEKIKVDARYFVEDENVKIDEDGKLTINDKCEMENIVLKASYEDENGEYIDVKEIELKHSWTNSIETDNGYDASIATLQEVNPVVKDNDWENSNCVLWGIRVIFIIVVILVLGIYVYKRRKIKR